MRRIDRVILIVLDSVGVGALPDAANYHDEGSNTLGNLAEKVGGLFLPNLQSLGLGNIIHVAGVSPNPFPQACYGKMAEQSPGKDTTTGHWELMGVVLDRPFPVYPEGFPPEIINAFVAAIGRPVLGNKRASGTIIIEELGVEHLKTGFPIVYTSADSVFQIAAHEDVIPPPMLYEMCKQARNILQGEHGVGRVIARPFVGEPGSFRRTDRRKDFSLKPPRKTVLDSLQMAGYDVIGIGKISDIFGGQGITQSIHTHGNDDGLDQVIKCLKQTFHGLIFVNLVDFDSLYGHRNDLKGYAQALTRFDERLPEILAGLHDGDLLIITADHGCDPTMPGTDHTREYVPLLCYGKLLQRGGDLGTLTTFADVGATIADVFNVEKPAHGLSFLPAVLA